MYRLSSILVLLAAAGAALAHHGVDAHFDTSTDIRFEAVVTDIKVINPHSYIYFSQLNPEGGLVEGRCELFERRFLVRYGLSNDSVPPGTPVRISGNPARREANVCHAEQIELADGRSFGNRGQVTDDSDYVPGEANSESAQNSGPGRLGGTSAGSRQGPLTPSETARATRREPWRRTRVHGRCANRRCRRASIFARNRRIPTGLRHRGRPPRSPPGPASCRFPRPYRPRSTGSGGCLLRSPRPRTSEWLHGLTAPARRTPITRRLPCRAPPGRHRRGRCRRLSTGRRVSWASTGAWADRPDEARRMTIPIPTQLNCFIMFPLLPKYFPMSNGTGQPPWNLPVRGAVRLIPAATRRPSSHRKSAAAHHGSRPDLLSPPPCRPRSLRACWPAARAMVDWSATCR